MNTAILQKCITELQKDAPDLSYLRGMLETLMEMQESKPSLPPRIPILPIDHTNNTPIDEAATLDAEAQAKLIQLRKDRLIA